MFRRIRELREDNDFMQLELAKHLGCTQSSYSLYELGKRDIPSVVWVRLAQFYHTSVDYMMGLTDEKEPYPRAKQEGGSGRAG